MTFFEIRNLEVVKNDAYHYFNWEINSLSASNIHEAKKPLLNKNCA